MDKTDRAVESHRTAIVPKRMGSCQVAALKWKMDYWREHRKSSRVFSSGGVAGKAWNRRPLCGYLQEGEDLDGAVGEGGSHLLKLWGARKLGAAFWKWLSLASMWPTVSGVHLWDSLSHLFCSVEDGLEEEKTGSRETSLGAPLLAHVQ